MTSQKAKDIVKHARSQTNQLSDTYLIIISNTVEALNNADKNITKESLGVTLKGLAISIILKYICDFDLEVETETFVEDNLVDDVTSIIWDDWLKEQVEKIEGDNVVPLKAVN